MDEEDEEKKYNNFYENEERYLDYLKFNNENENENDITFHLDIPAILKDNKDNRDYRCNNCLFFPYIEIINKNTMNYICVCSNFEGKKIAIEDFINNITNCQKKNDNIFQLKCNTHKEEFRYYCTKCRKNICKECCESELKMGHVQDLINFDFNNFDIRTKSNKLNIFYNSKVNKPIEIKHDNKSDLSELKENSSIFQENLIGDELKKDIHSYKIINDDNNSNVILEKNNQFYIYELFKIIYNNYLNYPNYAHFFNIENLFRYMEKEMDVKDKNDTEKKDELNDNKIKNFDKKGKDMMTIVYKNDNSNIKLFGDKFVEKYNKKVYLEINNGFYQIKKEEKFDPNIKEVEIKLYLSESIKKIDLSLMFNDCKNLKSIDGISKWKNTKITGLDNIFNNCKSLSSLPDISEWDVSEIKSVSLMFYNCYSLSKFPDLSKWIQKNKYLKGKINHIILMGFSFPSNSEEIKYINNKQQEKLKEINIENRDINEKDKIEKIIEPYKNKIKMLEETLNKKNEVMQIFVKSLTGKVITVDFEPLFTIENVKTIIQNKENIPIDHQRFLFNGRELKNNETLAAYGIQRNSTIHLITRYRTLREDIKIFVKLVTEGKTLTLYVELLDTIKTVKTIIRNIEGIPIDNQKLLFSARQLEDNKTLADYRIRKDATLLLMIRQPQKNNIICLKK